MATNTDMFYSLLVLDLAFLFFFAYLLKRSLQGKAQIVAKHDEVNGCNF